MVRKLKSKLGFGLLGVGFGLHRFWVNFCKAGVKGMGLATTEVPVRA